MWCAGSKDVAESLMSLQLLRFDSGLVQSRVLSLDLIFSCSSGFLQEQIQGIIITSADPTGDRFLGGLQERENALAFDEVDEIARDGAHAVKDI